MTLPALSEGIYSWFYHRRRNSAVSRVTTVPARVISVGNITTGGTGKTPAVHWLAERLVKRGSRVAVVSRGYGGRLSEAGAVVSDGKDVFLTAGDAGDEAVLHANRLPGVPVVIGRDRVKAALLACRLFGPEVILLDDGFQYWSLHRDLDLVLLDARLPFGNGRLLPAGRLREPVAQLSRAGAVLLTRCELADDAQLAATRSAVSSLTRAPIFEAEHRAARLDKIGESGSEAVEHLRGLAVWPVSALADNAGFAGTLTACGARVVGATARADHHAWKPEEWKKAETQAVLAGAEALVTTEKDAVKLTSATVTATKLPWWSLGIELYVRHEQQLSELIA